MRKPLLLAALLPAALCALSLAPAPADAFCGFYVAGADAKLFNNATQVVLMRDGTRTILSMQNNYQGPPESFAMVVPVPVVLQKENVKTLPPEIFARVDRLSAPRLVEYWEQDPCRVEEPRPPPSPEMLSATGSTDDDDRSEPVHYGVKIEAKFSVGEYDILILSAADSTGLDAFLRKSGYSIPAGAEPYLRPYVMSGSKFFVAKVDVKKVSFKDGQATLSPLRFHYDAETFTLPVRLGLINSAGAQDLIVNVLARDRYEVANYDNYAIPTNIDVTGSAKEQFGAFYAALFDKMLELHPKSVITEYAWSAGSCDPCPEPPLEPSDIATLGADAIPAVQSNVAGGEVPPEFATYFTLTRLHVRYQRDSLGEDLVFRAATGIAGGQGVPAADGSMDRTVRPSGGSYSSFQGRYVLRHPWTGPIQCENPRRGIWGGPVQQVAGGGLNVATNTAFAPRGGITLASMITGSVPELEGKGEKLVSGPPPRSSGWPSMPPVRGGGCAACSFVGVEEDLPIYALSLALGAALFISRRRAR